MNACFGGTSIFSACSGFFFLWFASWCRAVVWIISVACPVLSRKTAELPRIRFPSLSNCHMNSQSEGPRPYSLKCSFLHNRMRRVKADPICTSYGGPPRRDFLSTSPESCIEEVIGTIGKCIAFLSFPPLFVERCLLQAGEEGSRRGSIIAWGEGKGLVLSQERDSSRRPPNPFSLWKRERRERIKGESLYFLLLYIPATSFRFSKPKLKICMILSLPEYSLFNYDPGRCTQLPLRPSVNNTHRGFI